MEDAQAVVLNPGNAKYINNQNPNRLHEQVPR